jgi:hypothetical protein
MVKKRQISDAERVLTHVAAGLDALERKLDKSSKAAAREGGVMLAHACAEHDRARGVGMALALIVEPLLAEIEGGAS